MYRRLCPSSCFYLHVCVQYVDVCLYVYTYVYTHTHQVLGLRLPRDWASVPELMLQSNDGDYSIWTVLWHPRQVLLDSSAVVVLLG